LTTPALAHTHDWWVETFFVALRCLFKIRFPPVNKSGFVLFISEFVGIGIVPRVAAEDCEKGGTGRTQDPVWIS